MNKDDQYFNQVYAFAHKQAGSYTKLAKALGVPSGPAVQMWRVNGVAHKWRARAGTEVRRGLPKILEWPVGLR